MRKYILLVVVIIIVGGIYLLSNRSKAGMPEAPVIVEYEVERGPISSSVASTGRVVANLDVEIKCKASGEVITLPYDISDKVNKGELVVELDPIDEQRNVKKAEVSLSSSQARYKKAQQNLSIAGSDLENAVKKAELNLEVARARADDARSKADRVEQLYEAKLASLEEYEAAETSALDADADVETILVQLAELETDEEALELLRQDLNLAKADVESTQISLAIAQQRLEDTRVFAPIDGVITERFVQTGQIISSGISNVGGGTSCMTISDLSRLFVIAAVDESDIGKVLPELQTSITADAYPNVQFNGVVERIAQRGVNTSNVVTFEVRIEVLSDNKSLLKPEMTANVEIIIAQREDALTIPVGAVSKKGGKDFVYVLKADGTTETREVQVGINNGERIEIVSGLNEGDTIVVNEGASFSQWRQGDNGRPPSPSRMMGIRRR